MNQKGFTLIEILAVVAILGILTTMTIIGYSKYMNDTREKSYKMMAQSVKVAAEDYIMDNPANIDPACISYNGNTCASRPSGFPFKLIINISNDNFEVNIKDLVDKNYLKNPIDPADKSKECSGKVRVASVTFDSVVNVRALEKYIYEVNLCCSTYQKQFLYTFEYEDWSEYKSKVLDNDSPDCS